MTENPLPLEGKHNQIPSPLEGELKIIPSPLRGEGKGGGERPPRLGLRTFALFRGTNGSSI